MKKRLLSMALCLCMVLSLLPTMALAVKTRTEELNLCAVQYTTDYTAKIDNLATEGWSWERTGQSAYTLCLCINYF